MSDVELVCASWELGDVEPSVSPGVVTTFDSSNVAGSSLSERVNETLALLGGLATVVFEHSSLWGRHLEGNCLSNWVLESVLDVSRALSSVPRSHLVSSLPFSVVQSSDTRKENLVEFNRDVESSVISEFMIKNLDGISGPLGSVLISPWSGVSLGTPWVSHLDESLALVDSMSNDGISMTSNETLHVCLSLEATGTHNHVFLVHLNNLSPDLVDCESLVAERGCWHTSEHVESSTHPSSAHSLIVTPVLGTTLLEEWSPPGTTWSSLLSESWTESVSIHSSWKLVINGDSLLLTVGEQVEVDLTVRWVFLLSIEDLLDSFWPFTDSGDSSKIPAISKSTLVDSSWMDSL